MLNQNFQKALLSLGFVLVSIPFLAAQQFGKLSGKVIDKITKEPILFANITFIQMDSIKRMVSADMEGVYQLDSILVGKYQLKVSSLGYYNYSQNIDIQQDTQILDIYLEEETCDCVVLEPLKKRSKKSKGKKSKPLLEKIKPNSIL
jgi:CarboxypepD_reg-like domain